MLTATPACGEPAMELVAGPMNYTEGPAVGPDGGVWFTEGEPAHAVHRYEIDLREAQVVLDRTQSGGANGLLWLDGEGLLICRDRLDQTVGFMADPLGDSGNIALATETPAGQRFNGPNDIAAHEGSRTLYFTDPKYSNRPNDSGIEGVYAIRINPEIKEDPRALGEKLPEYTAVALAADDLVRPNGIAVSGDTLYVADNVALNVTAFDIDPETGDTSNPRVFADLREGFGGRGPDGMCVLPGGELAVTLWGRGVQILDADGERLGFIATGDFTSNVTPADDGGLWVTARNGLMKVSADAVRRALAGERVAEE